jgi:hypothetical protein
MWSLQRCDDVDQVVSLPFIHFDLPSPTAIASNTLGGGEVSIKQSTILRILMRTNRRFFSNNSGFVQNIFAYDENSIKPDNFISIEVLFFLFNNRKTIGHINVEGYFTCTQVVDEMQKLGYVPEDVFLCLKHLLQKGLIVTDRMNSNAIEWEDSVRILAAGWLHLRILTEEFEYLFGIITLPIPLIQQLKKANQFLNVAVGQGFAASQERCFAAQVVTWFASSRWASRNGISLPRRGV